MSYPQHYLLCYISYWLCCLWSLHGLAHSLGPCLHRRHRRLTSYHLQTTDQPGLWGTCITHLLVITLRLVFKEQWKWRPCMINHAFSGGSWFFSFQLINWHMKATVVLFSMRVNMLVVWKKTEQKYIQIWERVRNREWDKDKNIWQTPATVFWQIQSAVHWLYMVYVSVLVSAIGSDIA